MASELSLLANRWKQCLALLQETPKSPDGAAAKSKGGLLLGREGLLDNLDNIIKSRDIAQQQGQSMQSNLVFQ